MTNETPKRKTPFLFSGYKGFNRRGGKSLVYTSSCGSVTRQKQQIYKLTTRLGNDELRARRSAIFFVAARQESTPDTHKSLHHNACFNMPIFPFLFLSIKPDLHFAARPSTISVTRRRTNEALTLSVFNKASPTTRPKVSNDDRVSSLKTEGACVTPTVVTLLKYVTPIQMSCDLCQHNLSNNPAIAPKLKTKLWPK